MKRFTLVSAGLYLGVLLIVWGLLRFGSEYWWPVTILLFAPRWLLAMPLLVLLPMASISCRSWLPLFASHLAVLLLPIMGLEVGKIRGAAAEDVRLELRLLTCNLGGGRPRVDALVELIGSSAADIVLLQECEWELADQIFERVGWRFQHRSRLAIGSRCELNQAELLAAHGPQNFNQAAALACTVELDCFSESTSADGVEALRSTDTNQLRIVSIHLPTLRPALEAMLQDPFGGESNLSAVVDEHARVSAEASRRSKTWNGSLIVAGDFNMPVDSRLFNDHWGHLQNAYSLAGSGFGYTKFTRLHGVRIDHVLASGSWQAVSAQVAPGVGGDHRPMIVRLALMQSTANTSPASESRRSR